MDTLKFVRDTGHTTSTLHVYELIVKSGGGGDGGGVTARQDSCQARGRGGISIFERMKPLDVSKETL